MPAIRSSSAGPAPRSVNPDRMRKRVAAQPAPPGEPPPEMIVVRDAAGRPIRVLPAHRT